jgi:putative transposase
MPVRKTRKRFEIVGQARFLTFSCHDRSPLFEPDWVKDRFADRLLFLRERLRFRLHAWVIMPDHVHLLLTPDLTVAEIPPILHTLKRPFSASIRRELASRDITLAPAFWQPGGGYDRNIVSDAEYFEKVDYIHNNPIRRGLVQTARQWAWSSIHAFHGVGHPVARY